MVCSVHHKLHALADRAELADDQFVSNKFIMVRHMCLKILTAGVRVIVIGVGTHLDIGAGDDIFDIASAR